MGSITARNVKSSFTLLLSLRKKTGVHASNRRSFLFDYGLRVYFYGSTENIPATPTPFH
jgi:hypothetical protein